MSEKMITRKEFEAAVASLTQTAIYTEEECRKKVLALFEAAGFTVEPVSILPDVSGGEWYPCCGDHDTERKYYIHANGITIAVAYNAADRAVMAGSKRLVELVVAHFRHRGATYENSPAARDIFDQLEKMGVDVSAFRDGDSSI